MKNKRIKENWFEENIWKKDENFDNLFGLNRLKNFNYKKTTNVQFKKGQCTQGAFVRPPPASLGLETRCLLSGRQKVGTQLFLSSSHNSCFSRNISRQLTWSLRYFHRHLYQEACFFRHFHPAFRFVAESTVRYYVGDLLVRSIVKRRRFLRPLVNSNRCVFSERTWRKKRHCLAFVRFPCASLRPGKLG